jgi:hypothetical protein
MTTQMKLVFGGAAGLVLAIVIASVVWNARLRSLERAVDAAKQQAKANEEAAVSAEVSAAEHVKKIEYLENELAGIGRIARRQDEEIEKIGVDVGGARRDVERARGVRAIDASIEELCGKLAELGHPCR